MKITLRYSEPDNLSAIHPITWNSDFNTNGWWEGFLKAGPVILHSILVEE
jgi:hypothetical protein